MEDSVTRFEREQRERWAADAERRRKRDRRKWRPRRQNLYLSRLTTTSDGHWTVFVPDIPDLDAHWTMIDLRPDIDVVDGWCIVNCFDDVSWTDTPGLIKLANGPDDTGNSPRVVFNNRLGVETGANTRLGRRITTVLLDGDDANPNRWNKLKGGKRDYSVHCGVELDRFPRIGGGAVIADPFTRSTEASPMTGWSEVTGTSWEEYGEGWGVDGSNQATMAGDDWMSRFDTSLASGEHYIEFDLVSWTDADYCGPVARMNTTTDDCSGYWYRCKEISAGNDEHRLYSLSSTGGGTALGTNDTSGETISGKTIKVKCDDDTISGELDDTEYHSVTNTTHGASGRLRGGMLGFTGSAGSYIVVDNFAGSDLAVDATPTPVWDTNSDLIMTGDKINIVAPTAVWDTDSDWTASTFLPIDFISDDTDVTMTGQKVATGTMSYFTNTNWISELEPPALTPRPTIETVKTFSPSAEFVDQLR